MTALTRARQREAEREAARVRVRSLRREHGRAKRIALTKAFMRHPLVVVAFGLGLARALGLG